MATIGKASAKELEGAWKRTARLREAAKAAGLCVLCGKNKVDGTVTCRACWEAANERNRLRKAKLKKEKRARMMA